MTDRKLQIRNSTAEFLVFTAQPGQQSFDVYMQREVIPEATFRKFRIVQMERTVG